MAIYFVNIVGWTGTVLMVVAYFLVSTGKIKSNATTYQLMNLFGAIFLGTNVFYQKAWPAFAFETLWVLIAIYALIRKGNPMDINDLNEPPAKN